MMRGAGSSVRRGAAFERDWTKGSITRNLLSLSWPVIISESLYLVLILDMFWVAKLGLASIAGLGIARLVGFLLMSGRWGLIVGTKAMVARLVGAGDVKGANHAAIQAFVICAIYVIVVGAIGIIFAELILGLFGVAADVVREGVAYIRVMFVEMAAMGLWFMVEATMQASGDTVTPMKIAVLFRFFQVALCPFLIFGWWLFPRMGVSGVAMANVVTFSMGMSLGFWFLFTGRTRLRLSLRNFHFDPGMIWRIVKIGIPASIMGIQGNFGSTLLMRFLAPFGTLAVAGQALVGRVEVALHLPPAGIGSAAGVLAGQNLGARQPERAERSGWLAAAIAEGFLIIASMVPLLWAEGIIRAFNPEPGLVQVGSTFFRISVVGFLLMGFTFVLQQCISSAGDTLLPMMVGLVVMWAVQIPLAFFLPRTTNLGAYGVRWAMVTSWIVEAIAYIIYFRLGQWKRKRV